MVPTKDQNKAKINALTTLISTLYCEYPSQCTDKARKINKRHTDWKGRIKNVTAHTWYDCLVKNPILDYKRT